jgi:hypothetical protein
VPILQVLILNRAGNPVVNSVAVEKPPLLKKTAPAEG